MAGSIKLIKRRIRSVKNTAKLTKAMQMIATVNMRKAVNQSHLARPFAAETISFLSTFSHFIKKNQIVHPFVQEKPLKKVLGVVITSNRGLCGSFHTQLEKKIRQVISKPEILIRYPFDQLNSEDKRSHIEVDFEWLVMGKKGEKMIRRLDQPIIASFNQLNEDVKHSELNAIFKVIKEAFYSGKYQKVVIFYTQYINTLKQVPMMRQVLPLSEQEIQRISDEWEVNLDNFAPKTKQKTNYMIEPGRTELVEVIFLLLIKMILYYAVLESKASVESARMFAMKNATDAANDMGEILTLTYNQLRQSKITQEIAEISAGRAALE